ncbi:MAG: glucosyltransferase domain-containing protein [Snodgrassella sp.]|uniref:glucosyltransferase domain-containing protein n=1 Tax=Snodgrassella sp. TaxID=2815304 RepID=UPI00258BD6B8|nr:glucosyltransferase domain-containing protein [Snodgrassella sp.]MCO6523347.1 glucosyltransferase domain-containing protein [Snodgrassella sp.]
MQYVETSQNDKYQIAMLAFLVAFFTYICVYGFELTHFGLSIDEEFNNNISHTIAIGRWGHALLKASIYPEPFIPFYTEMLTFILLSASCALIVYTFSLSLKQTLFFAVLYASSAQFAYQLQFLNQCDTVATAILLSSMAVYLIVRKNSFLHTVLIPALLLGYAVAIYQSIIFFSYSLLLAYLLLDIVRDTEDSRHLKLIFRLIIASIIGLILYFVLGELILNYYHLHSESYLSDMFIWLEESPKQALKKISRSIEHYFTLKAPYGMNTFVLAVVFLILPLFYPLRRKTRYSLYVFLSIITLFSMNIVLGDELSARTMTSFAIFLASAGLISFIVIRKNKYLWAIAAFSFLYGMATVSNLFYADYISYKKDYRLASAIANDIATELNVSLESPVKVYFFGALDIKRVNRPKNSDMFGASFLNWDHGNSGRISAFMNKAEIANIVPASYDEIKSDLNAVYAAPIWPQKGSILQIKDVVVVKLGQNVGYCPNGVKENTNPKQCL